jgi:membrane-associated phospholipid phosphatase
MFFDRFVTPATTEWFSFFYFGYFFLLSAYIFPLLFLGRDEKLLTHFTLSMLIVVCIGQTLYMIVPGFGPYAAFPEAFQHPLQGGFWWHIVDTAVRTNGAHKDIFPSLHTALPLVVWLFTFSRRKLYPFRYVWLPLGFIVVNIILATMFLRWHYVIDVVAGATLAVCAHFIARRVAEWEPKRRQALGLAAAWPQF